MVFYKRILKLPETNKAVGYQYRMQEMQFSRKGEGKSSKLTGKGHFKMFDFAFSWNNIYVETLTSLCIYEISDKTCSFQTIFM